jgi:hypothetical protein
LLLESVIVTPSAGTGPDSVTLFVVVLNPPAMMRDSKTMPVSETGPTMMVGLVAVFPFAVAVNVTGVALVVATVLNANTPLVWPAGIVMLVKTKGATSRLSR